jgi:hypothetical protein
MTDQPFLRLCNKIAEAIAARHTPHTVLSLVYAIDAIGRLSLT